MEENFKFSDVDFSFDDKTTEELKSEIREIMEKLLNKIDTIPNPDLFMTVLIPEIGLRLDTIIKRIKNK